MAKEMTYEEAQKKLDEIVGKMQDKDISLDDSIKYYQKACELLKFCKEKLTEANDKIQDIDELINDLSEK